MYRIQGNSKDWVNVSEIVSFILGPDTDDQQSSMKAMHVRKVTSYLYKSRENVGISIIESTCLNDHLLSVSNDNTNREKRLSTKFLWAPKIAFLVPSLKLFSSQHYLQDSL